MAFLLAIISVLFALLFLIALHEGAHAFAARSFGVRILIFSFGFGKALKSWKLSSGTLICLGWLPLGGYVKLLDTRQTPVKPEDFLSALDKQAAWKRIVVFAAGPLVNLLAGFIALYAMFVMGCLTLHPVVLHTLPDSPAQRAHFPTSQEIIAFNGEPVSEWFDILFPLTKKLGETSDIIVESRSWPRKNQEKTLSTSIKLKNWRVDSLRPNMIESLGFVPALALDANSQLLYLKQYTFKQAFPESFKRAYRYLALNAILFTKILTGKISIQSLAGPLAFLEAAYLSLSQSVALYLNFLGFISLTIAFVNLLPIPALDGAHILYVCYEKIRGKSLTIAMEVLLYRLGIIILGLLFFQVLINDVARIFTPASL